MKKLEKIKDGFPFALIEKGKVKVFIKVGHYAGDYEVAQFHLSAERYGVGIQGQFGEKEIFKGDLKVIPVDFTPKSNRIQQWL